MINKHHLTRYEKLIAHFRCKLVSDCFERHHIVPLCLGGTNAKDNLVNLPTRAHFVAHWMLHLAYPDNRKLAHAFAMMASKNRFHSRKITSRMYDLARAARSKALTGVKRSEETKERMRKPRLNKENYSKPKSLEHAAKIGISLKGKSKSAESIEKGKQTRIPERQRKRVELETKMAEMRSEFKTLNVTKEEFAILKNLSHSTIKRYLREYP